MVVFISVVIALKQFVNKLLQLRLVPVLPSTSTVEPVLKDRPIGHKIKVSQDRWSLVTGSFTSKCATFSQNRVLQDRWSLMAVVSQDSFHCICT